jgi:hypothetical protein
MTLRPLTENVNATLGASGVAVGTGVGVGVGACVGAGVAVGTGVGAGGGVPATVGVGVAGTRVGVGAGVTPGVGVVPGVGGAPGVSAALGVPVGLRAGLGVPAASVDPIVPPPAAWPGRITCPSSAGVVRGSTLDGCGDPPGSPIVGEGDADVDPPAPLRGREASGVPDASSTAPLG